MNASTGWLEIPRDLLASSGKLTRFIGQVIADVFNGRVFHFSGEVLRQAGILIIGSAVVIWVLISFMGLIAGVEGVGQGKQTGNPAVAAIFTALANLRELVPYAFGYMMAAKVGTGIVAELGAMRISEEIDALEVMGIRSITFLASTRLLASWLVLPFIYIIGIGIGFIASYLVVVVQMGDISSGTYLDIFWQFQNPLDFLYSIVKAMTMATAIVLVGCYYGYTAGGGPVGVGQATAKSMILNIVLVHLIGMSLTQLFWGTNPNLPLGG